MSNKNRNLSFMNFVEFSIDGNTYNKAITLGDIDNDNNYELVIGCTNGKLLIYKYILNTIPWAIATGLGVIVCVDVGDICNQGMNIVITLSMDGWCNLFIIKSKSEKEENTEQKPQSVIQLTSNFKQKLPINIKVCLIVDLDGDGLNELVIGYTDRVVRYFKWVSGQTCFTKNIISGSFVEQEKWTMAGQIGSISATRTKNGTIKVMVSQPGGSYVILDLSGSHNLDAQIQQSSAQFFDVGSNRTRNSDISSEIICDISQQPHSAQSYDVCHLRAPLMLDVPPNLSIPSLEAPQTTILMTPLQSSIKLTENDANSKQINAASNVQMSGSSQMSTKSNLSNKVRHQSINTPFPTPQPLLSMISASQTSSAAVNSGVKALNSSSAESLVVGRTLNSSNQPGLSSKQATCTSNYSAICTLDGTLNLIHEDKVLWSLCVAHQLFSIKKLDVTGDGTEEVVVCSWDGQTYIVDLSKGVVRFQFRESVAAFHAGIFSIYKDVLSPCLVYITFNNKVVVYYNVFLPSIRCKTLKSTNVFNEITGFANALDDASSKSKLVKSLLYEYCG